jgi:hypothetical protein
MDAFPSRKSLAHAQLSGRLKISAPCLTGKPMAKRSNPRAIKAARTYTMLEGADALGVSVGTVRGWIRQGLPVMKAQRPYLILGDALRYFLEHRRGKAKAPLAPNQLYCLTCKQAQTPMGMMVDCLPQTTKTARLVGLCAVCNGICNRMVSRTDLPRYSAIFDVAHIDRRQA